MKTPIIKMIYLEKDSQDIMERMQGLDDIACGWSWILNLLAECPQIQFLYVCTNMHSDYMTTS